MHQEFVNKIKIGIDLSLGKANAKLPKSWNKITKSVYNNEPNFAILTGKTNDIIVIDLDNKDPEFIGLKWFEENFGKLQDINTLITKTINNGYHIYFKYNSLLTNKINMKNLNIDILTDTRCVYEGLHYTIFNESLIRELSEDELEILLNCSTEKRKEKDLVKIDDILNTTELTEIIMNLNKTRADNYPDWIRVGFFLYSQTNGYTIFKTFSKQSKKYNEENHDTYWNSFETAPELQTPITIGTMLMWLKEDNIKIFTKYTENKKILKELDNTTQSFGYLLEHKEVVKKNKKEIQASHKTELLFINQEHDKKSNCKNKDIISVVNNNGLLFKCRNCDFKFPETPNQINQVIAPTIYNLIVNIQNEDISSKATKPVAKIIIKELDNNIIINNGIWYKYNNVSGIYEYQEEELIKLLIDSIADKKQEEQCDDEWIQWMNQIGYKENLFKEIKLYSFNNDKLDDREHLLGFQNGVLDLKDLSFRKANKDEFITMKCNCDYDETIDTALAKKILQDIFQDPSEFDYALDLFSLCLYGKNIKQKITMNYGFSASNGKSFLMERLKNIFGDYGDTFNVNLLTSKNKNAGDANSTLINFKNKRFLYCSEPETNQKLNINLIKTLTGDTIKARGLYEKQETLIKPTYNIFMCCNVLPKPDNEDNGFNRRINILEYRTRFVDKPKRKDDRLVRDFNEVENKNIENGLMMLLIENYKKMKETEFKITIPTNLQNIINIYTNENTNEIIDLLNENFKVGDEKDFVLVKDIKDTLKNNNIFMDTITVINVLKMVFVECEYYDRKQFGEKRYRSIFLKLIQI